MSVIIKGIDMPKDCEDCRFGFYREGDSAPVCYLTKHIIIRKKAEERHHDCPLIDIVTCGECKYYAESKVLKGDMVCKYRIDTYYTEADRFCCYGERKE